ncbi:hypothetical protein ACWCP6_18000 [Streptomyces sp. NPDC002004]
MDIGPEDDTLDLTEQLAVLREAPGPPCDCWWHRRADHATQLTSGAATLARRLGLWLAGEDWHSLALRAPALAYGLGHLTQMLTATSWIGPAASLGFTAAAWRAGRPVPPTVEELERAFLASVRDMVGDRPAIFLRDLYDALQAHPAAAHLDDGALRALLVHCRITIHKSVRIGDQTGRSGIKAADIDALLSPTPVDPPLSDVDAGHDATEGAVDHP